MITLHTLLQAAEIAAQELPVLSTGVESNEMNLLEMASKGGWIMVVLALLSIVSFYILFERNYVNRKAGQ